MIYKIYLLPWLLIAPFLLEPQAEEFSKNAHILALASIISILCFAFKKINRYINTLPLFLVWSFILMTTHLFPLSTTLFFLASICTPYFSTFPQAKKSQSSNFILNLTSAISLFVILIILWSSTIHSNYIKNIICLLTLSSYIHNSNHSAIKYSLLSFTSFLTFLFSYQNNLNTLIYLNILFLIFIYEIWFYRSLWKNDFSYFKFKNPSVIIVGYFTILGFLGAAVLQIPIFHTSTQTHDWTHHLFTSISAVSVTGLNVLDISESYSFIGQFFILILIQLGGLGVISLSAWTVLIFQSHRLSIEHEKTLKQISTSQGSDSVIDILKKITLYVFTVELIGFFILTGHYYSQNLSVIESCWKALFLAISSFCNAGFTLQNTSMMNFQDNPLVLNTVSFLIIAGGCSPLIVLKMPSKIKNNRLDLTDRMILYTTFSLLLLSFLFFFFIEKFGALSHLPLQQQILNAWFQSVTLRTAGFYSIPFEEMSSLSQGLSIFMMFIGGNPGGTAGGIKTTTFAVLFCVVLNTLQGRKRVILHGRLIPPEAVLKAMTVFLLGLFMVVFSFILIMLSQETTAQLALFEVVSALSTVGLSLGLSENLNEIGRVIICGCMLAGRVGPLTFMLFLVQHGREERWRYPREEIDIS
ncbi:MAG: TrkH family potassium uptake protein [Oligoflexales bacterium]